MTFRKSIVLLVVLAAIAVSVGCSSSSAPPAPLTVSLGAVSTPLTVNSLTPVTATVSNDSANAGVTWSCSPAPGCGSFSASSSLSGVPVDYIAPPIVPAAAVVITATSVTTSTVSASSQSITIAAATLADGTYVFNLSGWDNFNDFPYYVAGAFVIKGGAITSGEQDYSDLFTAGFDDINLTGSTVVASTDGNMTITLVTCNGSDCTNVDPNVGVSGIETLTGAAIPFPSGSTQAYVSEFDASGSASGEVALQTNAAVNAPSLGYAFEITGIAGTAFAMGGILNVDSANTISGTNSIFDVNYGGSGTTYQGSLFSASSVTSPDAWGRVTFTLNPAANFGQMLVNGYIVDVNRILLVEEPVDAFGGSAGGVAYSQSTPNAFVDASFSGNTYVTGMAGFDTFFILQAVTQLSPNGTDQSVTGFLDYNDLSSASPVSPDPVSAPAASYLVDPTGRVTLSGLTDGTISPGIALQIYLDGNGHALTISMDSGDILSGIGHQQSGVGGFAASNFVNNYALNLTGWDANLWGEVDAVGPINADGSGTFSGFADVNWLYSTAATYPNNALTGTFNADASGIFTGTINGADVTTCAFAGGAGPCTDDAFSYYLIDPVGDALVIETDFNQLSTGRIGAQQ